MPFDGPAFIRHIAERLIHEFKFSQGAGTPGLIGAAKEHPARVQLERLMPGGVSVGSGIVVDSYGGTSKQQDIVIYENICPVFTHNDAPEATYYPVEGVIAVGEIKSGLGKGELNDAFAKSVSVKNLRRHAVETSSALASHVRGVSYRNYCNTTSWEGCPSEQYSQDTNSLHQIYSFVLCQKFRSSPETTLGNFAQECKNNGKNLSPNIIVALEGGTIFPYNTASGSITRSVMEADGAIFSKDGVAGFCQLMEILRIYVMSGKTVDRDHYHRYFDQTGTPRQFAINGHIKL